LKQLASLQPAAGAAGAVTSAATWSSTQAVDDATADEHSTPGEVQFHPSNSLIAMNAGRRCYELKLVSAQTLLLFHLSSAFSKLL
jgi:hypothetical protein